MTDPSISDVRSDSERLAENARILRLMSEERGWALSRILRAAELEAEVERLREANRQAAFLFGALGHDGEHDRCDPCEFVRNHADA